MTRTPESPSSSTRFRRSSFVCICWKSGTAAHMIARNTSPSTGITVRSTRARPASCENDRTTPPIAIIGAVTAIVSSRSSTCCTCVVSLVVRVTSEAVLKRSN
jgi:hypothetical protein